MQKKHTLAVYGTLRQGFGNNRLLSRATYLGYGNTLGGGWRMYCNGAFPYAVQSYDIDDEADDIAVELYEVDDDTLSTCNKLEGFPGWYDRTSVLCAYSDALGRVRTTNALLYYMHQDQLERRYVVRVSARGTGVLDWYKHRELVADAQV
jgi:gamma-glutamylcyclotransferase (GGCT)/AIG2-like uncharacterized protein YtfP